MDLEREVRDQLAKEAIRELSVRYSMALDDRRLDDAGDCFAVDASLSHVSGSIEGRAGIQEYYRERVAGYGPTFHYPHVSTIAIDADGNHATGVVLGHAELSVDGETFKTALRYHDTYQRDEDRWRITTRRMRLLYYVPLAELPTVFADRYRKRAGAEPALADYPEGDPAWEDFHSGLSG